MPTLNISKRTRIASWLGAMMLAGLHQSGMAQQYFHAPTSANGVDGWAAGWMSNLPPGTLNQDWYPGSGVPSTCPSPVPCTASVTHDPVFLSSTSPQRVGGGLVMAANSTYQDFQDINGLATNNRVAAMAANQYIEFPFRSGSLSYANGTPAPNLFYINGIFLSKRWNENAGNPRAFGYAAYIVDSAGTDVSGLIQQVDDVGSIANAGFHLIRTPDGPGPGIQLQPNTQYALRFYVYGVGASTQAVWDDTLFSLSRQAVAELQVTASTVSTAPSSGQIRYTYTFNVYNNGPDQTTARITDPLPDVANGAMATWACTLQPSGNPCATSSGNGPIDSSQTFASGSTAVYTVTWLGPQVTVPDQHDVGAQPLPSNPIDPITTNNVATVSLAPVPAAVPGLDWLSLVGLMTLVGCIGGKVARFGRRSTT